MNHHPQDTTSLPAALAATPPARKHGRRGLSPQVVEERLAFIRAGVARGETQQKIGEALGLTDVRICQLCAKYGIKPAGVAASQYTHEMRVRYAKANWADPAKRAAMSQGIRAAWADPAKREAGVRRRRKRADVHSEETVRKVLSLRGQKSAAQIAREMGFRSRNVVIGIWDRSSVPFSAPVSPPFPGAARPAEVPCRPAGRADLSQLMQAMTIQPGDPAHHDWFAAAAMCVACIASALVVGALVFSAVNHLF